MSGMFESDKLLLITLSDLDVLKGAKQQLMNNVYESCFVLTISPHATECLDRKPR